MCSAQPPRRISAASTKSWLSTVPAKGFTPRSSGSPAHCANARVRIIALWPQRSEEHTSELQSLMRISYAVFCLKKKTNKQKDTQNNATRIKNSQDSD